jgi:capsular exopolysaccharide synthesis family protein
MDLADYLTVMRLRWRTIAAMATLSVIVAAVVLVNTPTLFTAQAQTMIAVIEGDNATDLTSGTTFAKSQVASFAIVAAGPKVLLPVMADLGITEDYSDFAQRIDVKVPSGTTIIEVKATAETPQLAAAIADSVGDHLVAAVEEFVPRASDGSVPVKATVIADALLPTRPSQPQPVRTFAFAFLAGLLVGYIVAILRSVLDRRLHDVKDIALITDAPIVGAIRHDRAWRGDGMAIADGLGGRAEDYRRLRTNLQFLADEPSGRVLVLTSAIPGEGKTTTALNLAVTLAHAGSEVLLIDADMRHPSLADQLNLAGTPGLSSLLAGLVQFEDVARPTARPRLTLLPAGDSPPNPSELLASGRAAALLHGVQERYQYVIVDTPPLLAVTDAVVVGKTAGGAFIVTALGRTTKQQLRNAVAALDAASVRFRGIVVNDAPTGKAEDTYAEYHKPAASALRTRLWSRRHKRPQTRPADLLESGSDSTPMSSVAAATKSGHE